MVDFQLGDEAESSLLLDISSLPKAALALTTHLLILALMLTAWERVLPRYMKLLTACRFCPFTVMFGSWCGFPGAGWYMTLVFLVLIRTKLLNSVLHLLFYVGTESVVISKQKVRKCRGKNTPAFPWNCRGVVMNLLGQPNFSMISHKPFLLTVVKALFKLTKVMKRLLCCSWYFSWSWCAANIMSTVPRPAQNPHWHIH